MQKHAFRKLAARYRAEWRYRCEAHLSHSVWHAGVTTHSLQQLLYWGHHSVCVLGRERGHA